jgi:hypothetical protein
MIKNKNISIYIIVLIALLGISYSFFNKKDDKKQEVILSIKDYVLNSFLAELPEINKNLPHRIDSETTLLSIKFENNKILSVYELTSKSISREFLGKIELAIQKQVCEDEMKRKLIDVDIDFLNRYQNATLDLKFEIPINRSICSKI